MKGVYVRSNAESRVTRDELLTAGERLFAEKGVAHVQLQEITRAAGQRNTSAVQYYFGSRAGLVAAILDKHQAAVNRERREFLSELRGGGSSEDLRALLRALVGPPAERLTTQEGRHYLRIMVQLTERQGVSAMLNSENERLDSLYEAVDAIEGLLVHLPQGTRRRRVSLIVHIISVALAERAKDIDNGVDFSSDNSAFVGELVEILHGALTATSGGSGGGTHDHPPGAREGDDGR
jgi:AcrR family transcriptional regulator